MLICRGRAATARPPSADVSICWASWDVSRSSAPLRARRSDAALVSCVRRIYARHAEYRNAPHPRPPPFLFPPRWLRLAFLINLIICPVIFGKKKKRKATALLERLLFSPALASSVIQGVRERRGRSGWPRLAGRPSFSLALAHMIMHAAIIIFKVSSGKTNRLCGQFCWLYRNDRNLHFARIIISSFAYFSQRTWYRAF